jgi:hypothetical protein
MLTYVYCLVASSKRPALPRRARGLEGLGPVRLLPLEPDAEGGGRAARHAHRRTTLWAVVADAPEKLYGEQAINRGLSDLDWVSRAAVAHEAVVESFIASPAVLPMKLFTLFTGDDRVSRHVARARPQIGAATVRVSGRDEWSVRVVLDRGRAAERSAPTSRRGASISGARYLERKRAQAQATAELAERARETTEELYEQLARRAALARRRSASDLPGGGGALLLDAAFLVGRGGAKRFQNLVASRARALAPRGYVVTLSGPWPPYSFMQD